MIQILPEQWAALEDSTLRGFLQRAEEHVRRVYPEAVIGMSQREVERMIRGAVREARRFGLIHESTAGRYIAYRCELGAGFHEQPAWAWIGAILGDGARTEREKVDDVDRRLYGCPLLSPEVT